MRAAAADAGVSPALVMHHFGSKDGLDLARAVAEGGPAADRLVDRLVVLADQQLARWSATGAVRPSADPQMRAVALVV